MMVFSTGRAIYAHDGIIGISEDLKVSEGYDGGFPAGWDGELSKAESLELAEYMIDLWTKFAKKAIEGV